jgi:hypothetical protein
MTAPVGTTLLATLQAVAKAQKSGEVIEVLRSHVWEKWDGKIWNQEWSFRVRPWQGPKNYR